MDTDDDDRAAGMTGSMKEESSFLRLYLLDLEKVDCLLDCSNHDFKHFSVP